jgi:hypothetical protein
MHQAFGRMQMGEGIAGLSRALVGWLVGLGDFGDLVGVQANDIYRAQEPRGWNRAPIEEPRVCSSLRARELTDLLLPGCVLSGRGPVLGVVGTMRLSAGYERTRLYGGFSVPKACLPATPPQHTISQNPFDLLCSLYVNK